MNTQSSPLVIHSTHVYASIRIKHTLNGLVVDRVTFDINK